MPKAELSLKRKTDGRGFDALMDRTKPGGIKVGFVKGLGKHPGSNATISEVAAYNEFGTNTIPERPFLRTTIAEQSRVVYPKIVKELLGEMLKGKVTILVALVALGEKAAWDVKAKIDAISEPKNADATINQKKSSSPLIDTGLMRQSVTWEIVE